MNHSETHSHMADYLEGDLDLTRRALLDAHLDSCETCSQGFAEMRRTVGLLRGLESPEPPPFLVETVMRRIREGEGRVHLADRMREFVRTWATPQVALPATVLVLGLMLATGNIDPSALSLKSLGDGVHSAPPASRAHALALERSLREVRAPYLPVPGPPPAVARAPRVTITLPTRSAVAANRRTLVRAQPTPAARAGTADSGSKWTVTRWPSAPRSLVALSPNPLSHPVRNSTAVASGAEMIAVSGSVLPGSAGSLPQRATPISSDVTAFPSDVTDAERARRRAAELDQRLQYMMHRPSLFSAEFASYSVAEQEIWLRNLALRARELERGRQVLQGLRATNDRLSLQLATAFAAELRQLDHAERAEMTSLSGNAAPESADR